MSNQSLMTHVTLYVVGNAALALAWALAGGGYPWFAWIMLVWGVVLGIHALRFATQSSMNRLPHY